MKKIQLGEFANQVLEWDVLSVSNQRALIVCSDIIDVLPFQLTPFGNDFNQSFIQSWLNNEFYQQVFSKKEKQTIILTKRNQEKEPMKLFLLNEKEVHQYFQDDESDPYHHIYPRAIAKATPYVIEKIHYFMNDALRNKGEIPREKINEYNPSWYYYLDGHGKSQNKISIVKVNGEIQKDGVYNNHMYGGVRPACYINIE